MSSFNVRCCSVLLALLAGACAGCQDSNPKPSAAPAAPAGAKPASTPSSAGAVAPVAAASPAPASGVTMLALGLRFTLPAGWKQVPPANSMRLAEVQVPDASGDAAKACTVALSSAGGTVASNIDRWVGQVKDASGKPPKAEPIAREVAGLQVTTVELEGTYSGMGDGAQRPTYMLRGAIVETSQGLLFIKMTGPADAMKAAAPAFKAYIDSMSK